MNFRGAPGTEVGSRICRTCRNSWKCWSCRKSGNSKNWLISKNCSNWRTMATAGNSETHRVIESCKHNRKITVGYTGSIRHSGNVGIAESTEVLVIFWDAGSEGIAGIVLYLSSCRNCTNCTSCGAAGTAGNARNAGTAVIAENIGTVELHELMHWSMDCTVGTVVTGERSSSMVCGSCKNFRIWRNSRKRRNSRNCMNWRNYRNCENCRNRITRPLETREIWGTLGKYSTRTKKGLKTLLINPIMLCQSIK
jgi:hypothetical protein